MAATNTVDLAGEALPEFIRSRLRPQIEVGFPPREEIDRVVKQRFPRLDRLNGEGDRLLSRFWQLWREARSEAPPSPRGTLYLFGLMLNLADAEASAKPVSLQPAPLVAPATKHLEAAFRQLFPSKA